MVIDNWAENLTDKQQALVVEFFYAGGKLTKEVWQTAGYSSGQVPKRWISSETARIAIRRFAELQFDLNKDFVKSKAASIILQRSFYNPADIIDSRGRLLPDFDNNFKNLGDLAYCVDGIKTIVNKMGVEQIEIKLADRNKNIEMLAELFDFKGEKEEDEIDGKKSVYKLSEEEREQEIKQLAKLLGYKQVKKIAHKKKGK